MDLDIEPVSKETKSLDTDSLYESIQINQEKEEIQ